VRSGPGEERAAFFDKVAAAADEARFAEGSALHEQRTVADWADRRAERLVLRAARSACAAGASGPRRAHSCGTGRGCGRDNFSTLAMVCVPM